MTPILMTLPVRLLAVDYAYILLAMIAGGVFGSFFNVVIYRMPLDKSIIHPPSSCPKCGKRIRPWHNIPVLGWLLLRGKCFDCDAPISARYPLVEAVMAATFGMLALVEPLLLGVNLPKSPLVTESLSQTADLWLMFACHAVLMSWLLIAAGIDGDGHPLPKKLIAVPLVVMLAAAAYRPWIVPVPAFDELYTRLGEQRWSIGILTTVYGAVAGAVFGCVAAIATGLGRSGLAGRTTGAVTTAWVGATLGWQAAGTLAAISMLVYMWAVMFRAGWRWLNHVTYPGLLWLFTLLWIPAWGWIVSHAPLDAKADVRVIAAQGVTIVACATVAWLFRGKAGEVQSA